MGTGQSWIQSDFPRFACDHAPVCGCTKEAPLTHRSAADAESSETVVTLRRPAGSIPMSGDLERDTGAWIEVLVGQPRGGLTFHEWLQDGIILCQLANVIKPGVIATIHPADAPMFKKMENTTQFIRSCRAFGVMEKDLFSTVDLYEAKNLAAVQKTILNLAAVSRNVPWDRI